MQSGLSKTKDWVLEYDRTAPLSPEPLMGWTSSGDTLNQIRLTFDTREEAVAYAKSRGISFVLSAPRERIVRPRNYADNFKYVPPQTVKTSS